MGFSIWFTYCAIYVYIIDLIFFMNYIQTQIEPVGAKATSWSPDKIDVTCPSLVCETIKNYVLHIQNPKFCNEPTALLIYKMIPFKKKKNNPFSSVHFYDRQCEYTGPQKYMDIQRD